MVTGGRIAAALMALVAIRIVTTYLTHTQYGELALLLTVQMFCGLFLINPVAQHINFHTHAWWDDGTLLSRLRSYKKYIVAVSFIGSMIVLAMGKQDTAKSLLLAAAAMFSMIIVGTWNATYIWMLNMLGFRAASVFWGVVTAAISLVSSACLVIWLHSATAWFAGQAIGMGIGALGAKYVFGLRATTRDVSRSNPPLLDRHTILTYCLPLAMATGLMWIQLSGYRILVEVYWGLAQLGFLVVGLQVAGQIWALIETMATQFLYPLFYRRVSVHENNAEVEHAFSDLLNTLVPIYFVVTGLLVSCAFYLLKLLVAPQFQGAQYFVMAGAGIEMCRVLGNLLSNAGHVKRKTSSLVFPYAVGAISTLILISLAGTAKMTMAWVGGCLLLGAASMLLVMVIAMYRQIKFSIDRSRFLLGAVAMLAIPLIATRLPQPTGIAQSIGLMILIGSFATAISVALLWKNPAAFRLLNVQLRNS